MANLTDPKIRDITPPHSGRIEITDDTVPGLRLRVSASGNKSFIVRKRTPGGKTAVVTLGTFGPAFKVSDARKKARAILSDLEGGKAAPKVVHSSKRTIRKLLPGYYEAKKNNRTIEETKQIFERLILPALGDRLVVAVTRVDIKRFIKSIENMSNRRAAFAALSSFYTYVMDEEDDLDEIAVNPCRDAKRPPKAEPRERVLSDAEIGALYRAAGEIGYPYGTGVRLLVFTALRRGEVFKAEWSEIDMKKGEWVIPAARSKNKRSHLVPLTPAVKAILETLPRFESSPYLFPARGLPKKPFNSYSKGAAKLKAALTTQLPESPEWRIHDVRRTAATKLQATGAPLPVVSAILNHTTSAPDIGSATKIYALHQYKDEKRAALTKLEAEILRLADPFAEYHPPKDDQAPTDEG